MTMSDLWHNSMLPRLCLSTVTTLINSKLICKLSIRGFRDTPSEVNQQMVATYSGAGAPGPQQFCVQELVVFQDNTARNDVRSSTRIPLPLTRNAILPIRGLDLTGTLQLILKVPSLISVGLIFRTSVRWRPVCILQRLLLAWRTHCTTSAACGS